MSKRPTKVRCDLCGGPAHWKRDLAPHGYVGVGGGFLCHDAACGWAYSESMATTQGWPEPLDDDRIRGPEDVAPRLLGALDSAKRDGRLDGLPRKVHAVYVDRALEANYVEIMAGDVWVCEQLGLDPTTWRTRVQRARYRLSDLGYVRHLEVKNVSSFALKDRIATRKADGKRPVTLLEVRGAPPWPVCDDCGGPIPDVHRVSKRFCSDRCRQRAGRDDPRVVAAIAEALAS